jgi:hypothetical protein
MLAGGKNPWLSKETSGWNKKMIHNFNLVTDRAEKDELMVVKSQQTEREWDEILETCHYKQNKIYIYLDSGSKRAYREFLQ